MNDKYNISGENMIKTVKELKQFLANENENKTLSILAIDDENLENWIDYAKDKDYVEIVDGALGKVVIATLSP